VIDAYFFGSYAILLKLVAGLIQTLGFNFGAQ
jgi:hypothetical protein